MWIQAGGLFLTAATSRFEWWLVGSLLLGLGTAMVYPSLITAVSDASHPSWRARSLSVYRFWRDLGYAIGALSAGLIADRFGLSSAITSIAALTFLSGTVVAMLMRKGAHIEGTRPPWRCNRAAMARSSRLRLHNPCSTTKRWRRPPPIGRRHDEMLWLGTVKAAAQDQIKAQLSQCDNADFMACRPCAVYIRRRHGITELSSSGWALSTRMRMKSSPKFAASLFGLDR